MLTSTEVHRPAELTITRPATAPTFAVNDILGTASAGAFEWTGFLPGGSGAMLTRLALTTNSTTVTNARFRVHFWDSNPNHGAVDDALLPTIVGNGARRLGYVDLPAATTGTGATGNDAFMSEALAPTDFAPILFPDISGTRSVWLSITALAAYVGVSGQVLRLNATLVRA